MTNGEIEAKWDTTEQMLKVDYEHEFRDPDDEGQRIAKPKAITKTYLRSAVSQLRLLDKHDEQYQTPWTRNQFMWVLEDTVGTKKREQAKRWMHECFAMTKKYGRMTA